MKWKYLWPFKVFSFHLKKVRIQCVCFFQVVASAISSPAHTHFFAHADLKLQRLNIRSVNRLIDQLLIHF